MSSKQDVKNHAELLRREVRRAAGILWPRRCPLCDGVLERGSFCHECGVKAKALFHEPPQLPGTEFPFLGEIRAAALFYYRIDPIPHVILMAKRFGHPWYARELADAMAVKLFGAQPSEAPGEPPHYEFSGFAPFDCIVSVPSRKRSDHRNVLPALLADRLGEVLQVPVCRSALSVMRELRPQKSLELAMRRENQKGAYAVTPEGTAAVQGRRILLVDDIITTGATVFACTEALLLGGAESVMAVAVAANDQPPHLTATDTGDTE